VPRDVNLIVLLIMFVVYSIRGTCVGGVHRQGNDLGDKTQPVYLDETYGDKQRQGDEQGPETARVGEKTPTVIVGSPCLGHVCHYLTLFLNIKGRTTKVKYGESAVNNYRLNARSDGRVYRFNFYTAEWGAASLSFLRVICSWGWLPHR